jgi:mRNA-degrading endonuclease RelE of RelBE toxin-antitoxin system
MSSLPTQVEFTPLFIRFLKHLAKKCRRVQQDLTPLLDKLERGQTPGTPIPGVRYPVYKIRVKNSDVPKGKSGGYRVI